MDNRCAIYMKADPLMKKDIDVVKKIQKIYHHVDIILDRKWQNDKYKLTFAQRADIVHHDFKREGIEDYKILANDTSKYDSILKEGVKNIAVEINPYSKLDGLSERESLTKKMIPDANIIFIPNFSDAVLADNDFLFEMIMEDSTHSLYKKYISDFAYIKTKLKLMTKIGITGNRGCGIGLVVDQFKQRSYEVVDLDQMLLQLFRDQDQLKSLYKKLKARDIDLAKIMNLDGFKCNVDKDKLIKACINDEVTMEVCQKAIYDSLYMKLAEIILKSDKKIIIVSSTLLYEFKIDWMFDSIIAVYASDATQRKRMADFRKYDKKKVEMIMQLHMPIDEKVKKSDYFIDGDKDEETTVRNTVNLINYKIESQF